MYQVLKHKNILRIFEAENSSKLLRASGFSPHIRCSMRKNVSQFDIEFIPVPVL